jgi:hypothetical protein
MEYTLAGIICLYPTRFNPLEYRISKYFSSRVAVALLIPEANNFSVVESPPLTENATYPEILHTPGPRVNVCACVIVPEDRVPVVEPVATCVSPTNPLAIALPVVFPGNPLALTSPLDTPG